MNNNYKILINNDKQKIFKLDNISFNIKSNTIFLEIPNYILIKVIYLLLLIILFLFEKSYIIKLKEVEIYDYKEQKFQKVENQTKEFNIVQPKDFYNITLLKNEMHYYSLYNYFKCPIFSLVIMGEYNSQHNLFQTINKIKNKTCYQNFSNFEIILYLSDINKRNYNILKSEFNKDIDEKTLIFFKKRKKIKYVDSNLINSIKGIYTIFINNTNIIENTQLVYLFNYIKGKINYYYNVSFPNDLNIYAFKTKQLKYLIDQGIEFTSFDKIISDINSISTKELNYIHISLCPDNSFVKYALVSMSSILSTKASYTYICFYIVVPTDFEDKNKNILESLYEEYDYFNITFILMDDRYKMAYTDKRISQQAYYRFSLGELLPNLDKIIYLDTDIIAYKDLSNLYNINFNGKMILGQPTFGNKYAQKHGYYRINTGILLLNLLEMRKNKFEEKVIKVIKKGIKFKFHDQTLVDDYFKKYLGIFPPEFHARPWSNYREIDIFNKRIGKIFEPDYFYFAHKYPTIRHFLGYYKPKSPYINHIEDWWFYARKSKYFINEANTYDSAFSF